MSSRTAPAEKSDDFDLGLSDLSGSGSDSDASVGNSGSDSNSDGGEQHDGEEGELAVGLAVVTSFLSPSLPLSLSPRPSVCPPASLFSLSLSL